MILTGSHLAEVPFNKTNPDQGQRQEKTSESSAFGNFKTARQQLVSFILPALKFTGEGGGGKVWRGKGYSCSASWKRSKSISS